MVTPEEIESAESLLIVRFFKNRQLNRIEARHGEKQGLVGELNRLKSGHEGTDLRSTENMNPQVAERYFKIFPALNSGWTGVWMNDPIPE